MNSRISAAFQEEPFFFISLVTGCAITFLAQVYYIGWLAYDGSRLTDMAGMVLGLPIIYLPWIASFKINDIRHIPGLISASFNLVAAGIGLFGYLQLLDAQAEHSLSSFAFVVVPTYQAIVMVFFYLATLRNDKRQKKGV